MADRRETGLCGRSIEPLEAGSLVALVGRKGSSRRRGIKALKLSRLRMRWLWAKFYLDIILRQIIKLFGQKV
jgi:hypothetical protein